MGEERGHGISDVMHYQVSRRAAGQFLALAQDLQSRARAKSLGSRRLPITRLRNFNGLENPIGYRL